MCLIHFSSSCALPGQQHVCRLTTAATFGASFARQCCEALLSQCSHSRALTSHCGNRHRRKPAPLQRSEPVRPDDRMIATHVDGMPDVSHTSMKVVDLTR